MPRIARVVVPDAPHHVTQRGNGGEDVFFSRYEVALRNVVSARSYASSSVYGRAGMSLREMRAEAELPDTAATGRVVCPRLPGAQCNAAGFAKRGTVHAARTSPWYSPRFAWQRPAHPRPRSRCPLVTKLHFVMHW